MIILFTRWYARHLLCKQRLDTAVVRLKIQPQLLFYFLAGQICPLAVKHDKRLPRFGGHSVFNDLIVFDILPLYRCAFGIGHDNGKVLYIYGSIKLYRLAALKVQRRVLRIQQFLEVGIVYLYLDVLTVKVVCILAAPAKIQQVPPSCCFFTKPGSSSSRQK